MEGWRADDQPYKWAKMGKPLTPAEREKAEVEKLAEYITVTIDSPWPSGMVWDVTVDALAGQSTASE